MSREILFRGKRIDNGEWVYGYYGKTQRKCTSPHAPIMFDEHWIIEEIVTEDFSHFRDVGVIPETVGQWTGLTDKNEKKIFEGDVVVPVWVSPSGKIDGINEDIQGEVIYKAGSFYVVPRCEREYQISNFVRKKFIEYRSNVGEIYDFENNVFLGEVIGTIFDKEGENG